MKKIYIDLETTGLNYAAYGVIELAGIGYEKDKKLFEFSEVIKPFPNDMISIEALKVTGIDYKKGLDPLDAHKRFTDTLSLYVDRYDKDDKYIFMAYNAKFDADFLRSWFGKCGDKYYGSWFHTPPIDLMSVFAYEMQTKRIELENFKLETIAKANSVIIENSHRALDDCKAMIEIENRLMKNVLAK